MLITLSILTRKKKDSEGVVKQMKNVALSLHILNNGNINVNKEILSVNKPDKEGISRGTEHSFQPSEYLKNADYTFIKEVEKLMHQDSKVFTEEYLKEGMLKLIESSVDTTTKFKGTPKDNDLVLAEYAWQYVDYDKEYSPKEIKQKIKEETRSNQGKRDEQFS
jgi:hypothetical protein